MPSFGSLVQTPDEPYPEQGAGMPETYQSPAGRALANIGLGLAKAIWDIPRKLGQAAEVPAGLRREDVTDIPVRHGITGTAQFGAEPQDELVEGTTGSAINRIGTGLPFAPRGVGAFGGKLAKPVEAVQSEVPHQSPYAGWHEAMEGIKAYHGSPHDFDRFDMNKIGTGEGAQAYGHGLYFAGNEGVAKSYRDTLAPGQAMTLNGVRYDQLTPEQWRIAQWIENTGAHPEEIAKISEGRAAKAMEEAKALGLEDAAEAYANDHLKTAQAARELAQSGKWDVGRAPNGRIYEVNIKADPEHFLDWDKPLSEQHPKVIGAMHQAGYQVPKELPTPEGLQALRDKYGEWGQMQAQAIAGMMQRPASEFVPKTAEAAQALREAGIPGIKYLDQGSRFQPQQVEHLQNQIAGLEDLLKQRPGDQSVTNALEGRKQELANVKPTHNYVVFDDKLIDILRKYGWAGLVGSAGLLGGADGDRYSTQ